MQSQIGSNIPDPGVIGERAALVLSAFFIPAVAGAAWMAGHPPGGFAVFCAVCAACAFAAQRLALPLSRWVIALVPLVQTMALTAAFEGHAWQIDSHMVYFAVLAVTSAFYDVRILLVSAGLIALHHLGMSLSMPGMIYPAADGSVLGRTVFHAVIVVVEAATLSLAIVMYHRARAHLDEQQRQVEDRRRVAEEAQASAAAANAAAIKVVETLRAHLEMLAHQDLSRRIDTPLPPEYEALRGNFNSALASLGDVLRTAVTTSSDYKISAQELSGAADDLAQRAEAQARAVSQAAERLQVLTTALNQTAGDAKSANESAASARDHAQRNGSVVNEAVDAMHRIEQSSSEISNIISLIEDISFQTNLLALNAGVEAARAGEAGRGFAVVASEVRALAQRTSQAAQDVKTLIGKSSDEVRNGSDLVNAAGTALTEIVSRVSDTSALIDTIATSLGEQSGMVREMNAAIQSLEQATRQNAAVSEEMTAMGRQMMVHSGVLSGALSGFALPDRHADGAAQIAA